jgi:endonuclease/exonuclease/phosphatase family metal-dependent hydrolase
VLVDPAFTVLESREIALNPFRYRHSQAARLGLDLVDRLAWSKERRVCQSLRVELDGETFVIGNLHATSFYDKRVPDAELLRAAVFVDGVAKPGEPIFLCGDFNLSVRNSRTLEELTSREWSFGGPTPTGIDHILVRGRRAGEPRRWPNERRSVDGRVLSDHAPVERDVS